MPIVTVVPPPPPSMFSAQAVYAPMGFGPSTAYVPPFGATEDDEDEEHPRKPTRSKRIAGMAASRLTWCRVMFGSLSWLGLGTAGFGRTLYDNSPMPERKPSRPKADANPLG